MCRVCVARENTVTVATMQSFFSLPRRSGGKLSILVSVVALLAAGCSTRNFDYLTNGNGEAGDSSSVGESTGGTGLGGKTQGGSTSNGGIGKGGSAPQGGGTAQGGGAQGGEGGTAQGGIEATGGIGQGGNAQGGSSTTGGAGQGGTSPGGTVGSGGAGLGGRTQGGTVATGGVSKGGSAQGGTVASGGVGLGGRTQGGTVATGGVSTGGVSQVGSAQGGTVATGGAGLGGRTQGGTVATGGVSTGGVATGGVATGGVATGGVATGGAATGGATTVATGGSAATGGSKAATGGATSCVPYTGTGGSVLTPPSNGFEANTTGWSTLSGRTVSRASTNACEGSSYLVCSNRTGGTTGGWDGPTVDVLSYLTDGHTYTVTLAARFDPAKAPTAAAALTMSAVVSCTNTSVSAVYTHIQQQNVLTSWVRFAGTLPTTLTGCTSIAKLQVYVETADTEGTDSIDVDNFMLIMN